MRTRYIALGALAMLLAVGAGCNNKANLSGSESRPDASSVSVWATSSVAITSSTPTIDTAVSAKTVVAPKKTVTSVSTKGDAPAPKQYTDLLATYRTSGYYFQFANCQAIPGTLTVKKGSKIMIDNRDNKTRKIAIGNAIYTLNAYGYSVITVPATPKLYFVTCDGGGSARLTVQP